MGLSVSLNPNGVGLETALKAPLMSQGGVTGPTAPLQPLLPVALALAQQQSAGQANQQKSSSQSRRASTQTTEQTTSPADNSARPSLEASTVMALVARQDTRKKTPTVPRQSSDELVPSTV